MGPAGNLIRDDSGQKVHVGELTFDGLSVAGFQGVQDAGEAQLFEQGDDLGHGVHEGLPSQPSCSSAAGRRKRAESV